MTVCREVLPTKLRYHSLEFCHFVLYNIDIENKGSAKKHSVNIPKPEAKRKTETGIKPMQVNAKTEYSNFLAVDVPRKAESYLFSAGTDGGEGV